MVLVVYRTEKELAYDAEDINGSYDDRAAGDDGEYQTERAGWIALDFCEKI